MPNQVAARFACDSLVALGNSTADGATLFAKNSDRPANECQPLLQVSAQSHAAGAALRCTYVEIPQVAETCRLIGSRPFWCWGFEHGLNEHGVAIGNHTVFSKEPVAGKGLIGMDLVRLGLERGRSATHAVEVITALLEAYGQGGSGYFDKDWAYHNSFLVADRSTAFVLETSDRHWAVRRVEDVASVSNHLSIGADWEALSDGVIEDAIARGWWGEESDERFDFAAAYRDTGVAPEAMSSGRHQRSCALLESGKGFISVATLKAALRDHYGAGAPLSQLTPADPRYFSICMHAEPVGTTTASVIANLRDGGPLTYWASLGSPCVGAFLPLYVDADIPAILSHGGEHPSDDSPWWLAKRILTLVETDWAGRAPRAREELEEFETSVAAQMERERIASKSAAQRTAFMHATVDDWLACLRRLAERL
ncbi:MAG TPA: C69 family dipeptidase [Candidatus Margulisiibacteriota bacterium]|nr:C69 family dipeptidase [Candidatus Margulisiibacteriota bacterium]